RLVCAAIAATACGSQGNGPSDSVGSLGTSSADWSRGNPDPNRLPHALPQPSRITDCNLPEYVGILTAFNAAQISTAQLALSVSQNLDVRAFAQQMLTDEQNLATQLSTFMTQATVTPVQSEISTDITLTSQALLAQLRGDENFDRDFVVGEIGAHWMLSGFFQTMAFSQDFTPSPGGVPSPTHPSPGGGEGLFVEIIASAMHAVQVHLNLAFQVESKLVGMCGVAPAVVVTPDAGSPSDCGCPSGSDSDGGGSCHASSGR
ncbi:MAG TPA: DUF4142 domain-containing protein, partial [Polyangiaceae bacterium]